MANANILILEDDSDLLNLYSRVLTKAGHSVYPAMTLASASDLLKQVDFDVVLSDIGIGSGRSLEMLRAEIDTLQGKHTEIVIVSGREEARYICQEMGIDFFLHKPVATSELRQLIERLVHLRAVHLAASA